VFCRSPPVFNTGMAVSCVLGAQECSTFPESVHFHTLGPAHQLLQKSLLAGVDGNWVKSVDQVRITII
jgi:hypothetical protein